MGERAKRIIAWGLLAGLAGACPAAAQGVWSVKAPMPAPREDVGAVALDGKVYVLGGTAHEDAQITRNEVYDPATDTWSSRALMPRGSHHLAVALLNRKSTRSAASRHRRTARPSTLHSNMILQAIRGRRCPACRAREDRLPRSHSTASCT